MSSCWCFFDEVSRAAVGGELVLVVELKSMERFG